MSPLFSKGLQTMGQRTACRYFISPSKAQWLLWIFGFRPLSLCMFLCDAHNKQQFLVLVLVWPQSRRCLQCYTEASTNVGLNCLFSKCLEKIVSGLVLPVPGFIPSRNAHPSIPRKHASGHSGTCGNPTITSYWQQVETRWRGRHDRVMQSGSRTC